MKTLLKSAPIGLLLTIGGSPTILASNSSTPIETIDQARLAGQACAKAVDEANATNDDLLTQAFVACLSPYIRIATINRNDENGTKEDIAAAFLAAAYDRLGIPSKVLAVDGRFNVIATLAPTADGSSFARHYDWSTSPQVGQTSIILLHHMDVVDAFAQQWEQEDLPFSGAVRPDRSGRGGDYIWGRGALDMKSTGIMQLLTMAQLRHSTLKQTVHALAVADEEQGSRGSKGALREMQRCASLAALTNARLVLNEGGFGIRDGIGQGVTMHVVGAEDKGGAWLEAHHPSLAGMMTGLAQLGLLPTTSFISNDARCELQSASTPKAKVNVVASRVEMTLTCTPETSLAALTQIFGNSHVSKVGPTWSVIVETNSSGHGSLGLNASALELAYTKLVAVGAVTPQHAAHPPFYQYVQTPATQSLLNTIGSEHEFGHFFGIRWAPHLKESSDCLLGTGWLEQKVLAGLGASLASERLFRTSCTWTSLTVQPSGAQALIDCRLVEPKSAEAFIAAANEAVADQQFQLKALEAWDFTSSAASHPAYAVIKDVLTRETRADQRVVVTPFLFPMSSDNTFFRDPQRIGSPMAPIPSFGFFPAVLDSRLIATIHGSDERFPLNEAPAAIRRYGEVVREIAQSYSREAGVLGGTHYELSGSAANPVVVLVHGVSGPMDVWDKTVPALVEAGYQVLRYDLYGRGESARLDRDYDQNLFDEQLFTLITNLKLATPLTLVGSSLGGVISAEFRNRHPALVKRLVLIGPAGQPIETTPIARAINVPGVGELLMGSVGSWLLTAHHRHYFVHPEAFPQMAASFAAQLKRPGTTKAILSTMRNMPVNDFRDGFAKVGTSSIPVLLIWGEQDLTFPFTYHSEVQKLIPQTQFIPVKNAAHLPQYEQPDEVNAAMLKFLEQTTNAVSK